MHDREPTLSTLLADPLIRTVMRADRVDPAALETMLIGLSRTIDSSLLQVERSAASCCC
jgi:hypothetical protein